MSRQTGGSLFALQQKDTHWYCVRDARAHHIQGVWGKVYMSMKREEKGTEPPPPPPPDCCNSMRVELEAKAVIQEVPGRPEEAQRFDH